MNIKIKGQGHQVIKGHQHI